MKRKHGYVLVERLYLDTMHDRKKKLRSLNIHGMDLQRHEYSPLLLHTTSIDENIKRH